MDSRRGCKEGEILELKPGETELLMRLEWTCLDRTSVADLDLSCATYDRKVSGITTTVTTTHMFIIDHISP